MMLDLQVHASFMYAQNILCAYLCAGNEEFAYKAVLHRALMQARAFRVLNFPTHVLRNMILGTPYLVGTA
jgi:hypothetical protein